MNSWAGTHKKREIRALVIAQQSTVDYLITIIEPKGKRRIPYNYFDKDAEHAKASADSLVQIHYPHNCKESGCEEWERRENPYL
jgi:hypothetical protein